MVRKAYKLNETCLNIESNWNMMEHGDAREGKWRGNWRMEWVASTLHTTSEHGVSSITTADAHTSAASSRLNWRPHRADLNGLVRFAERRNLVSARVPSHFKRSLHSFGLRWRQHLTVRDLHQQLKLLALEELSLYPGFSYVPHILPFPSNSA
jgi:hypothetical protein